jgi:hypothetical protein
MEVADADTQLASISTEIDGDQPDVVYIRLRLMDDVSRLGDLLDRAITAHEREVEPRALERIRSIRARFGRDAQALARVVIWGMPDYASSLARRMLEDARRLLTLLNGGDVLEAAE